MRQKTNEENPLSRFYEARIMFPTTKTKQKLAKKIVTKTAALSSTLKRFFQIDCVCLKENDLIINQCQLFQASNAITKSNIVHHHYFSSFIVMFHQKTSTKCLPNFFEKIKLCNIYIKDARTLARMCAGIFGENFPY